MRGATFEIFARAHRSDAAPRAEDGTEDFEDAGTPTEPTPSKSSPPSKSSIGQPRWARRVTSPPASSTRAPPSTPGR